MSTLMPGSSANSTSQHIHQIRQAGLHDQRELAMEPGSKTMTRRPRLRSHSHTQLLPGTEASRNQMDYRIVVSVM